MGRRTADGAARLVDNQQEIENALLSLPAKTHLRYLALPQCSRRWRNGRKHAALLSLRAKAHS